MNNDLKKLIEHIDRGGETTRELDLRTGRIVSKPVAEGEIGRKIGSTIGGIFGKGAGDRLGQVGSDIGDMFGKSSPGKSNSNKSNSNEPGNISDFSSGPVAASRPKSSSAVADTDTDSSWNPPTAGRNADGSFNADHPFVKAMDAKTAANKNPNGNNGHDGSGIDPNDDPADPKTWPPGVKPAPDFGYLDPQGMWIPTPFDVRTESGRWKTPKNSPANYTGIMVKNWTPFQQKYHEMQNKSVYTSRSAIEQSKAVKLPGGAPQIPGYKQIDPKQFSSDMNEPGVNVTINWSYAYKKDSMLSKDFILIGPMLFYNTKLSIGRHYPSWGQGNLRSDNDKVPSNNGTVYVSAKDFNVNDMILDVVVHVSTGAPNIGSQILQNIKI
jgi:hypothetical protein